MLTGGIDEGARREGALLVLWEREEDVGGFEVPVDDVFAVEVSHTGEEFAEEEDGGKRVVAVLLSLEVVGERERVRCHFDIYDDIGLGRRGVAVIVVVVVVVVVGGRHKEL